MNSSGMNSKIIVNNVSIFGDSGALNGIFNESYWDDHCFLLIVLG